MFYDEFAIYDRPSTFYAWAQKNTSSKIPSNERKRNKVNGLLAVDVQTGEEHLSIAKKADAHRIAIFFALLAFQYYQKGKTKMCIILDNARTHKTNPDSYRERNYLKQYLEELKIQNNGFEIEFIDIAPYSPKLNLAEYIIHLIRLKYLHHLPVDKTIEQVCGRLNNKIKEKPLQTPQQIQNTLNHIFNSVADLSTE